MNTLLQLKNSQLKILASLFVVSLVVNIMLFILHITKYTQAENNHSKDNDSGIETDEIEWENEFPLEEHQSADPLMKSLIDLNMEIISMSQDNNLSR
jgi:hypothetical protein